MRKLSVTLLAASAITLQAQRQMTFERPLPQGRMHQPQTFDLTRLRSLNPNFNKAPEFRWLNYGIQLDQYYTPNMAEAWFMHNFPDSTVVWGVTSGGEVVYPWIHKSATILDPKNMPDPWITPSTTYTLDSLGIVYAYLRALPATVVDSVIVEIIKHDNNLVYTGIGGNYTWQDIEYDYTTNNIRPYQVIRRIGIPLTQNDSTSFAAELLIPVTGVPVQPGGNRIGAVVSYKPGFTYSITDTLSNLNEFYQLSLEQNGANTDPNYYGTPGDPNSDLNASFILPISVRYNFNPNGWNGYLIPTWAFATGYRYEHHLIEFGLTADLASVKTSDPSVELFNPLPVPADDYLTLNMQLVQPVRASVRIYDLAGRMLHQQNLGLLSSGFNVASIPVAHLATGTYTLTLETPSGITSRKIVVKH